jgi:hypothetical protein
MKIAIVTSHFTPTLADHTRITNGLDAIVVKAIPVLRDKGHEVHVICAGHVDEYWKYWCSTYSLTEDTVEKLVGKSARMNLTRSYYKDAKSVLLRINPDLVWSHLPSPGTSAEIAKDFPTIHHVHEVNQNAMYAIGRLTGLAKVIENGGTVYNSYFAERQQRAIAADFIRRTNSVSDEPLLTKKITSVYQFVNAPLDQKFLTAEVQQGQLPLMVGRYDEKFTGKNVHLVDKLGIPMVACVSGNHTKIWNQLRESSTTETHFNLTRGQTIDVMSRASCHIMAYLHETVGIFNYECLCLGSVPVTIGLSKEEPNAAYTFGKRILGDVVPECIPIDDPHLKERLETNVNQFLSTSLDDRMQIAQTSREALSHDRWYQEFISCIPQGSTSRDAINSLDLV